MNLALNDTLSQFKLLADDQQYRDTERVVLADNSPVRGEDSVRPLKRREVRPDGTTQFDQNNDVRTALLNALKGQFNGNIPESVRKALVGTGSWGAEDMDTGEGERVITGRPLTMRRIRQVLNAVNTEMQGRRASLFIDLADGQLTPEVARALVKDQLRLMAERWPAENVALSEGHLASLRSQIDTTDLKTLARLYEGFAKGNPDPAPADRVERTPALRERLDAMLSTAEGREQTAAAAQGVPAESRESFVKFLGRPDVRRQLVEHMSQLDEAPLYWRNAGQWNDDFAVSQLVSLWQNEQLAVENEQRVLTDRLASGLAQKDMTVATEEAVNGAVQRLEDALAGQAVLENATVIARRNEMQEALETCQAARVMLAEVQAGDIVSNSNGARNILAVAVEAEITLAEKITSYANAVRQHLAPVDQLVVPEGPEDVIDTTDPAVRRNEQMDLIGEALVGLDDIATPIQSNAMKLERVGQNIVGLGDDPDPNELNRLASELAALTAGTAPTEAERTAAEDAVGRFVRTVTPLMEEIAKLETLPPDAKTAELAGQLSQSLETAMAELANLNGIKGVDPDARAELRTNLENAQGALRKCGVRLRETLLAGMTDELATMLTDSRSQFGTLIAKMRDRQGMVNLNEPVNDLRLRLDDWRNRLNGAAPETRQQIIDEAHDFLMVWGGQNAHEPADRIRFEVLDMLGLNLFLQKCAVRNNLSNETSPDEPFSRVDARLLGMVLRGEIDAVQYVHLKLANYPEEMFRADLVEMDGVQKQPLGHGAFNAVFTLDMQNVHTGKTEKVVLKDVEMTGGSAQFGVGGHFSSRRQARETGKINYATSKAATLIGCGHQITKCGMVRVGSRFLLAQELAPGDTFENINEHGAKVFEMPDPQNPTRTKAVSFTRGCNALKILNPGLLKKLKQELQIAAAKLEWADLLTGQIDRTLQNVMLKIRVTGTTPETMHVEVQLKGVDNDSGFTEGHVSLFQFKTVGNTAASRRQRVYNAADEIDLTALFTDEGMRNFRMPAFLPLSVKRQLDALDEETFRREMGPVLGRRALDSAVSRLRDLKELARLFELDDLVVDDLNPKKTLSADKLEKIVLRHEERRTQSLSYTHWNKAGNLYRRLEFE